MHSLVVHYIHFLSLGTYFYEHKGRASIVYIIINSILVMQYLSFTSMLGNEIGLIPFYRSITMTTHNQHRGVVFLYSLTENIPGISFDNFQYYIIHLHKNGTLRMRAMQIHRRANTSTTRIFLENIKMRKLGDP